MEAALDSRHCYSGDEGCGKQQAVRREVLGTNIRTTRSDETWNVSVQRGYL